jgi:hypothetical protein
MRESKLKVMACEREAGSEARFRSTDCSSVPVDRHPEHGKPPERVRLLVEDLFTADVIAAKAGT